MSRSAQDHRALAFVSLAVAISGISWSAVFVRWAGVPAIASAFYRVTIAASVLVPWWALRHAARRSRPRAVQAASIAGPQPGVMLALAGGIFFACDLALFNAAIFHTTAASAVLLANVAPIFVGLGSWLLFHRRPAINFWLGLAVALGGCAIMAVRATGRAAPDAQATLLGDGLALSAAVFWASYLLTTERVREQMDTLTFNMLAMVGSAATLLVAARLFGEPLWGYSARSWLALAALGLISQLGAYLALTFAFGHLPATLISIGLLSQVPATALLAVPLLDEPITGLQLFGGSLVLAGLVLVRRQRA